MAKLRHIALAVPDPDKAAKFYSETFGMQILEKTESPLAYGWYLSDGTICLALLKYSTDEAAGLDRGKDWVGTHHFGFWVDNVEEQQKIIEKHGGKFFMELPTEKDSLYYEAKFRDPDGVIFDISAGGWVGAKK
jgi:catechol 2,3-dioxygenase-like lactoylglutathione lyase family enzyme